QIIAASAAGRPGRDIAEIGGRLFLVVSEPARFAEETLGTLTVGYALDDAVAQQLAQVTHCEVNLVVGRQLSASSLKGDERTALANLVAHGTPLPDGGPARMQQFGAHEYLASTFPLSPNGDPDRTGRLVLLQDWAPTNRYLAQLRHQLFAAGAVIFALGLGR